MNATVVYSYCSSSPCNSAARQSSASNVGLSWSPFRDSSCLSRPGGCTLSLSAVATNSSFFQIPHWRRKQSFRRKFVFVVKGSSSTFELDEEGKGHELQIAESARERTVTKGRVSWSSDGKAKILWATPKQQERASWSQGKHQSSGFSSQHGPLVPSTGEHQSSGFTSQHGPPVPSAGEHKNSFSLKNQQRASHTRPTISKRPTSPIRGQTDLFDASSASRLQSGLLAFKQAARPDAFGAAVKEAEAFSTRNEHGRFQNGAPMHEAPFSEEGTPQSGSVFTSKLEEILNNFRTRQKQEEFWIRQKGRNDSFEEEGAASSGLRSSRREFQSKGRISNSSQAIDAREPSTENIQNSNDGGFIHETAIGEVANEGHRRVPRGKRTFTTGKQNAGGDNTDYDSLNPTNTLPRGVESGRFSASQIAIESEVANEGHRRVPRGERMFTTGKQNAGGDNTDFDSLDPTNAFPWGVESGRFSASQMHSAVRKGSSSFAERRAAKPDRSQYNSKNVHSKSKARDRGADIEKPDMREKRTERSYTSRMNQDSHAQMSAGHISDIRAEENVDNIASSFISDAENNGSYSAQSENAEETPASSAPLNTSRPESLIEDGKASWHSHSIPSLPFEFQYSYSETPKVPIVRYREAPFSPFGPDTLSRPWTGGPPMKKSKKNLPMFDSFNPPPKGIKGIKYVQDPGPYPEGQGPKPARSRDEILGEPLTSEEVAQLVDRCQTEKRQLNLGRDGLTHNMLDLIHSHWKRRRVIKIRCLGVPTVDMDNVCFHLEDKTGGKIIFRAGGNVYLFRGRNYNYKDRPVIPIMLWKPPTPVYPKLIKRAPVGLTQEEADQLRLLGKKVEPLCTLGKNGVYLTLVKNVRAAFKVDKLVRVDCCGLNPSDYKKIGAKLKDLVPCVLLSFDDEQILMWKGRETDSADAGSLHKAEAAEAFTDDSSASSMGAASPDINDLRAEVSADVSNADNESHLAIEEIQQSSSSSEGFNTDASPPWSADGEGENASLFMDGSAASSWSLDNGHASALTGTSREKGLSANSEINSSLHIALAVEGDRNLDEPNLVLQDTASQSENDVTPGWMPGHGKERNASSGSSFFEKSVYRESSYMTEHQEREGVVPEAAVGLESMSTKKIGAAEEGQSDTGAVVSVDDLWDQAIASGIAIQLDEVEIDNDAVVKKASELANAVPPGEEYTRQLMSKLRVRRKTVPKVDDEHRMHFRSLQKLKNEKKYSKRPFRIRKEYSTKERPEDVRQNGGMPVDELARLLSMR